MGSVMRAVEQAGLRVTGGAASYPGEPAGPLAGEFAAPCQSEPVAQLGEDLGALCRGWGGLFAPRSWA
jgi:hypothetical protein